MKLFKFRSRTLKLYIKKKIRLVKIRSPNFQSLDSTLAQNLSSGRKIEMIRGKYELNGGISGVDLGFFLLCLSIQTVDYS